MSHRGGSPPLIDEHRVTWRTSRLPERFALNSFFCLFQQEVSAMFRRTLNCAFAGAAMISTSALAQHGGGGGGGMGGPGNAGGLGRGGGLGGIGGLSGPGGI